MEPNNQILTNPVDASNQSDRKRTYAMVTLVVVAVLGVGFGITGMVLGMQKSNEIQDLETQLAEKVEDERETVETINDCSPTPVAAEEESSSQENVAASAELAKDYIYVGAWGKKFKIPSSLKTVSFVYDGAYDYLCVSGVKYIEGGMHYFPEFASIEWSSDNHHCLGVLSREWSESGYQYRYSHPQALYGDDGEVDWETGSVDLVQELLTKNMEDF